MLSFPGPCLPCALLTKFVNLLVAGKSPPSVTPPLCGATLTQPDKSGGLSTIAVGEAICRLVSKCLATALHQSAFFRLAPLHLGASVRGGCEAIVHATSYLMSSSLTKQHWTLILDFTNAFKYITWEAMFGEFCRRLPVLSAWMESCYSCQSFYLGTDSICSCCGV